MTVASPNLNTMPKIFHLHTHRCVPTYFKYVENMVFYAIPGVFLTPIALLYIQGCASTIINCVKHLLTHKYNAYIHQHASQRIPYIHYENKASPNRCNWPQLICLDQLHEALRTPEITAAATSVPTVTTSKLLVKHSYLITILRSV